jgi:hypothetical protein
VRARARGRGIGANVFASTATPTCPAGQHWEDPTPTALRGLGDCVPNVVTLRPLTLRTPTTAAAAPPPLPPAITTDAAPAPAPAPSPGPIVTATCPTPWPLWWLLVAAAAGAVAGRYVAKNQKKVKKNAGRIVNAAGGHLVDRGMSRLLG